MCCLNLDSFDAVYDDIILLFMVVLTCHGQSQICLKQSHSVLVVWKLRPGMRLYDIINKSLMRSMFYTLDAFCAGSWKHAKIKPLKSDNHEAAHTERKGSYQMRGLTRVIKYAWI